MVYAVRRNHIPLSVVTMHHVSIHLSMETRSQEKTWGEKIEEVIPLRPTAGRVSDGPAFFFRLSSALPLQTLH
jgi:hypothetical protein